MEMVLSKDTAAKYGNNSVQFKLTAWHTHTQKEFLLWGYFLAM